jgi:predicted lipid-binding transport protein (Tim44 family)
VSQDDDTQTTAAGATVSGADVVSPGIGTATDPKAAAQAAGPGPARPAAAAHHPQAVTERPEVLVGAAFAGAFVVARILKSIFD